jgi:ElaB/YqjD/DUF883 family membrane-anchored ribosome-binding protein
MSTTANNRRAIEQRRQLHTKIARARRRLNQHKSRLIHGGFLPIGWRQQIQDKPLMALTTAAGIGMLLAQLCGRSGGASKSADWLAQRLGGETGASLIKYFEQFLSNSGPPPPSSSTEPENA